MALMGRREAEAGCGLMILGVVLLTGILTGVLVATIVDSIR